IVAFHLTLHQISVRMLTLDGHTEIKRTMMAGHCRQISVLRQNQRNSRIRIAVVGAKTSSDRLRLEQTIPRGANGDTPTQVIGKAVENAGLVGETKRFADGDQFALEPQPSVNDLLRFPRIFILKIGIERRLLDVRRKSLQSAAASGPDQEKLFPRQHA